MQALSAMALALLLAASAQAREQSNPLGQVVSLLNDLSAKIAAEGEAEAATFKEYSEWCDDTKTNTKFAIETGNTQKAKLEAEIVDLSATIEADTSKIGELSSSIGTSTADLKAATAVREKEVADFSAAEGELVEVIDTLGRAVSIISREMQKNPAAFAQVGNNLAGVVQSLGALVDAASFSSSDKQRLLALVQSQQAAGEDADELGAPAAAVYESHSTGIVDTLGDLQEKAEAQLSELRKAEVNSKHNYAMLKQSLEDQIAADNKDMDARRSSKAAAEEGKATASGDLSVTVADLKADEEALASATANCAQVAADHDATVQARNGELKVVADAIQILKESTAGAVGQTYSFLQLRSHADLVRSEVVALVKKLAKQHHSAALAQLSSRIAAIARFGAASGESPFGKVKGLINDMIAKLEAEAQAEATEKAYCDDEQAKTDEKKAELNADISKLTTKIDQAAARSATLKEEVKTLQGELATMASEQAEADKIRQETHANFVQAKADLEQGLAGVRKALVLLRDYYAAKSEDAFLQQPARPELHSKSGGAAESIIGILEVAESDFASNLAKETDQEATAQDSYESMTQENKVTKAAKDQDVTYKTKEHTSLDKSISELSSDRETANTELSAVMEYDAKLKERCVAKPETYETRAARREAEIAGLKEALTILEGEALLQRRGHGRKNMRGGALLP